MGETGRGLVTFIDVKVTDTTVLGFLSNSLVIMAFEKGSKV